MSEMDWSTLKKRADNATKPAPPGSHVVEIKKASWKHNSSGNPMYSVQGVIVEGPAEGKSVFNNFNVTVDNDFAVAIFFRHMAALGLDEGFFAAQPSHDAVCQALVGRRAVFELEIRQWQGQDRNGVTDVRPLSAAQATAAAMLGTPTGPAVATATVGAGAPQNIVLPPSATPPRVAVPTPSSPAPATPFDVPRS